MSRPSSTAREFTWTPHNHEIIKQRYGWPPFRWKVLSEPEKSVETYYDKNEKLSHSGLLVRTRSSKTTAKQQWEAVETVTTGHSFLTTEEGVIKELIQQRFPGCSGAARDYGLEALCSMLTTRTVFEAEEKVKGVEQRLRIVLDVTNWGHRAGLVVFLGGGDGEPHAQIDAFMARYPTFFDSGNTKSTLASWRERMGINNT